MKCPKCGYERIIYSLEYDEDIIIVYLENGCYCGTLKKCDLSGKIINVVGGDSGYVLGEILKIR